MKPITSIRKITLKGEPVRSQFARLACRELTIEFSFKEGGGYRFIAAFSEKNTERRVVYKNPLDVHMMDVELRGLQEILQSETKRIPRLVMLGLGVMMTGGRATRDWWSFTVWVERRHCTWSELRIRLCESEFLRLRQFVEDASREATVLSDAAIDEEDPIEAIASSDGWVPVNKAMGHIISEVRKAAE